MMKIFDNFGSKKEEKIIWWSMIEGLEDVVPVQVSSHHLPDWWIKKTDNVDNKGTIKMCPAIPEFMSMGFVVSLWCDLKVEINEDGSFRWDTPSNEFTFLTHSEEQLSVHLPKHARPTLVLKPVCPWRVKTPSGISMLQLPMFWHFNPNFSVASGVIWTDIHHEINQQMLFHKTGTFNFKRGTPLAQYIPIRRENIPHEVSPLTPELIRDAQASSYHVKTKFSGGYTKHRKDEIKKKQCPIGKW